MPDFNPQEPGDDLYPQYNVTTTMPISADLQILKGVVYTTDAAGRLVDVADVTPLTVKGIFQAKATPEGVGVLLNDDRVQVLGPRSRMILKGLTAGLNPGDDVIIDDTGGQYDEVVEGPKSSAAYIGKVFEIYTKNSDSTKKDVSEVGDLIVVETVQA